MARRLHRLPCGEEGARPVGGTGGGVFFAGTDGVEAVDVPEVTGGGAGDCGVGVCAGRPSGAGEGAADEGGGGFSEAEGRGGGCCDSG